MPLPTPDARQLKHTRKVVCEGYQREDGLWDIEGHLTDTKTYQMPVKERNEGFIEPGEPLHGLSLRITIDLDLNILDVQASMDFTPFKICPNIAPTYQALIGHKIEPGFTKLTRSLFSGTAGCTHLLELLGPIATTAYQATHQARAERDGWFEGNGRPPMLDSCHALDITGPVVANYFPHHWEEVLAEEINILED